MTPLTQLLLGTTGLALAGWMAVATSAVVVGLLETDGRAAQTAVLQEAYQARLDELAAERDDRAAEAYSAQNRFHIAMDQIGRQQMAILKGVEERRELASALDLMRSRLQENVQARTALEAEKAALSEEMTAVSATLARSGNSDADLTGTIDTVAAALAETARDRDEAEAERKRLAQALADLELRTTISAKRQDEMLDELEQAIALSMAPLETVFRTTELDVDSLLATVRSSHSGQGGPASPVSISTRSFVDEGMNSRFDELMIDLDRVNLLRIAAGKVPYAMPVKTNARFTSGFGRRSDPFHGGGRMHKGIDLAGPLGTPIHGTADGVVVSAGRESGYGNVVRIRHEFGFETLYAHLSRIRVKAGQQVSRGEHIGDMGSTGRSTGVHLHYELHLNGSAVNPMTYLEAARDVF